MLPVGLILLCWVCATVALSDVSSVQPNSADDWTGNSTRIGAAWPTLAQFYQEQLLALMPAKGHKYSIPSWEILTDMETVVVQMMSLKGTLREIRHGCSSIPLGSLEEKYQIGFFQDADFQHTYCVLVTTSIDYPWGSVVVHPSKPLDTATAAATATGGAAADTGKHQRRNLSIDCPHPLHDENTGQQSIAVFQGTNARSLVISGGYRYSSNETSCQGQPFSISDAAHSHQHGFHAAVSAIWKYHQQLPRPSSSSSSSVLDFTSIQFHGMGTSTCPGVDAYLTHGMGSVPASPPKLFRLWNQITSHFSRIHNETFVLLPSTSNPTRSSSSSSSSSSSFSALTCSMSGASNIQGRLWNGIPPDQVCSTPASSVSGRFVHLEQKSWMRDPQHFPTWVRIVEQAFGALEGSTSKKGAKRTDAVVRHRKRDKFDEQR